LLPKDVAKAPVLHKPMQLFASVSASVIGNWEADGLAGGAGTCLAHTQAHLLSMYGWTTLA
jgi:hypothetical protein